LFGALVGAGVAAIGTMSDDADTRAQANAFGEHCARGAVRAATRLNSLEEAHPSTATCGSMLLGSLFSELAYKSHEQVKKGQQSGVMDLLAQSQDTDVSRWILYRTCGLGPGHEGNELWLAFRGTSSAQEALLDVAALPVPLGNKQVHHGFKVAAELVTQDEDFQSALRLIKTEQQRTSCPLNLVGHSLGGAMAMMVASMWQKDRTIEKGEVLMYGSPPVHSESCPSRKALGFKAITLVVNNSDVVPRILSSEVDSIKLIMKEFCGTLGKFAQGVSSGWKHPSGMSLYVIGPSVVTQVPESFAGQQDCWLGLDAAHGWGDVQRAVSDHSIEKYRLNLTAQLG
jgi:hypothetical protein